MYDIKSVTIMLNIKRDIFIITKYIKIHHLPNLLHP